MTALVCIPTYNEAENIVAIVARTLAASGEVEVLVVDDNSPDGTGAIADGLSENDPRVHVLHRSSKQGLGAAYSAAFSWGLRHGYDVLVEMDADGSHQPEQLPRLLDAVEHADLAIGSRWVRGGKVEGWPLSRWLISRSGSAYARIALGLPQHDVTGGFRAYRADAVRVLGWSDIDSTGYSFQIELLLRAAREGLSVAEVPITFIERRFGRSKMGVGIVVEAMMRVTVWAVRGLPDRLRRSARHANRAPRPVAHV